MNGEGEAVIVITNVVFLFKFHTIQLPHQYG